MTLDRESVTNLVREHLGRHSAEGFSVEVLEHLVRHDNDWWHVPVRPSRRLPRISPYYELLAEVEEEIDEQQGLNVLLVPTLPDE